MSAELYLHITEDRVVAQEVRAVCYPAQSVPLEKCADNFRKAERRDGEIVALEAQHGDTDERSEYRGRNACYNDAYDRAEEAAEVNADRVAEHLRYRKLKRTAVKILINGGMPCSRDGEYRVSICADEHKARLTEREQSRKAVEQVHRHAHQRVYRALLEHRKEHQRKF